MGKITTEGNALMLRLIYEFFKTGLLALGGGIATIPFLYDMSVRYGWVKDLGDTIAFSSAAPGPTGVNMAVYFGFTAFGVFGGLAAMLALVTPSIIVISAISKVLKRFGESKMVKCLFTILRPASAGLLAAAVLTLMKGAVFVGWEVNWTAMKIFAAAAVALFYCKYKKIGVSPIWVILCGGILGYIAG